MMPNEKAHELVDKFTYEISGIDKYNYCLDSHILFTAKQCALVSVDEILSVLRLDDKCSSNKALVYWWLLVKEEIEKL